MPRSAGRLTDSPTIGFDRSLGQNDEALTAQVYANVLVTALDEIYRSSFRLGKFRFAEARRRLKASGTLAEGWDTYGAEAPNDLARALAGKVLGVLEAEWLPPTRLMPSSEGGIAISFVEGDNRAEIEVYNLNYAHICPFGVSDAAAGPGWLASTCALIPS